jgi:aspartyl-tRNA(Asn)/glutamyl-tRNA(Gln) amidotransferase subunit A
MNEVELTALSLAEASELVHARRISPVELTQAYLKRIEELDGRINSFITVTADLALAQARQAENELMRARPEDDRPFGRLHGAPLALKDLFETRDVLTTAGSKFFAGHVPAHDCLPVRKLREAGAVLLGKTNMHEIALGLTSANPHFGPVRNPWARERVAGGSSGGSAAAVSARLCPAALGTDTGGSIRVPAALCGVAGLKPTFGRISVRGVIPLSWNLDHVGPMARRVQDLAFLLQTLAGYDSLDPYSADVPVEDYSAAIGEGVRDWRIALADGDYFAKTEAEIRRLVEDAGEVFEGLGAQVERADFPGAYEAAFANGRMVVADAAVFHAERLHERPEDFGPDVRQRLVSGAALGLPEYIQARRSQTLLRRQFEDFFDHYDLLLLPTTPVAAPPIEGPDAIQLAGLLTRYTAPFNLTGLPAISIPCGFTSAGLPVGLQIVARPWGEAKLLRAAYSYEGATSWHLREPVL